MFAMTTAIICSTDHTREGTDVTQAAISYCDPISCDCQANTESAGTVKMHTVNLRKCMKGHYVPPHKLCFKGQAIHTWHEHCNLINLSINNWIIPLDQDYKSAIELALVILVCIHYTYTFTRNTLISVISYYNCRSKHNLAPCENCHRHTHTTLKFEQLVLYSKLCTKHKLSMTLTVWHDSL